MSYSPAMTNELPAWLSFVKSSKSLNSVEIFAMTKHLSKLTPAQTLNVVGELLEEMSRNAPPHETDGASAHAFVEAVRKRYLEVKHDLEDLIERDYDSPTELAEACRAAGMGIHVE